MSSIERNPAPRQLSPQQMQDAAEAELSRISQLARDLTEQIDGQFEVMDELLRSEAARLFGIAFDITAALSRGDIPTAYRIAFGGPDQSGTVLGVVA